MLRKNKVFNFDYINLENKSESLEKNRIKTIKTIDQSEKNSSLIVGKNVTINGSIKAGNEVIIEGKVEADVEAKAIHIGKNGEINGNIKANIFKVEGKAKGKIEVENVIKLLSSGAIDGQVHYRKLEVEEGGSIKGEINIYEEETKKYDNWESM